MAPWLLQTAAWFVIFLPLLWLSRLLWRWLLRPVVVVMRPIIVRGLPARGERAVLRT